MQQSSGTAIVVGASSGIGKAIAEQLAGAGWKVGLTSRKLENLEEMAAGLGERVLPWVIDVDDPDGSVAKIGGSQR